MTSCADDVSLALPPVICTRACTDTTITVVITAGVAVGVAGVAMVAMVAIVAAVAGIAGIAIVAACPGSSNVFWPINLRLLVDIVDGGDDGKDLCL